MDIRNEISKRQTHIHRMESTFFLAINFFYCKPRMKVKGAHSHTHLSTESSGFI